MYSQSIFYLLKEYPYFRKDIDYCSRDIQEPSKISSLLGKFLEKHNIEKINIADKQVVSIIGNNGKVINSDNYIWCADPHSLFYDLIDEKYLDKNLRYMYDNPEGYVSNTGYQVAFGIVTEADLKLPEGSIIFPCDEYDVAGETKIMLTGLV